MANFEKRVIPGKTYCVTVYSTCQITAEMNNVSVTLVDASEPGQYLFTAPTTTIVSDVNPSYIVEVIGGSGIGSGIGSGGAGGASLKIEVVETLPETGKSGIIYFVPIQDASGNNTYEEWVWLKDQNRWESLGPTTIELSNYAVLDGDNTYTGNQTYNGDIIVTINGGLSAGEISGEIEVVVEAPELTISHGTWFNNSTQDTIKISPATWNNAIKTCYIKSSIPVTLTGVTRIDDNPIMETGKIYVFALQQIDATTIIANMAYSITA